MIVQNRFTVTCTKISIGSTADVLKVIKQLALGLGDGLVEGEFDVGGAGIENVCER